MKDQLIRIAVCVSSLAAALGGCSSDPQQEVSEAIEIQEALSMQARHVFPKGSAPKQPSSRHRLIVKFQDSLEVRATPSGEAKSQALSSSSILALEQISRTHNVRFSPLLRLPEHKLASLKTRATRASGRAQPDLAGIFVVEAPQNRLQAVANALHASPLTEFVYFEELAPPPPSVCEDIPPVTPDYVSFQNYLGPDPGMNMTAAWNLGPTRGAGVRIADCEYGYVATHEDLCGVISEPGQTPVPDVAAEGWDEHGTAVVGELVSADNAYGCTGLVPEAEMHFFPEWTIEDGFRRHTAVANAIAAMDAGDVVLLEMQTATPNSQCGNGIWHCAPAEIDPVIWMLTKNGTDAGVIVVAAAGSSSPAQDLDGPAFAEYRSRGDSGAIIVGAGSPDTSHNHLSGTFGSRVDVQGWGASVFTLGYGSFAEHGGDKNQRYTSSFNGTSSAAPFIAAAVASIQGFAEQWLGHRLSPVEMRQLLIATGIPQGSGGHIGPFPDMVAAVNAVMENGGASCGNHVCEPGETCSSCPADCGPCPGCVPQGCETATTVTLPYVVDGPINSCVFFQGPGSNINSWNMSSVEINGLDVTNAWVSSANYPSTCDGGYYLRAVGNFAWSHVEAR